MKHIENPQKSIHNFLAIFFDPPHKGQGNYRFFLSWKLLDSECSLSQMWIRTKGTFLSIFECFQQRIYRTFIFWLCRLINFFPLF